MDIFLAFLFVVGVIYCRKFAPFSQTLPTDEPAAKLKYVVAKTSVKGPEGKNLDRLFLREEFVDLSHHPILERDPIDEFGYGNTVFADLSLTKLKDGRSIAETFKLSGDIVSKQRRLVKECSVGDRIEIVEHLVEVTKKNIVTFPLVFNREFLFWIELKSVSNP